jgi:hypothetical protein
MTDDDKAPFESILKEYITKANEEIDHHKAFLSALIHRRGGHSPRDQQVKKAGELMLSLCLMSIDHLKNELNKINDLKERADAVGTLSTAIMGLFLYGNVAIPSISDQHFKEIDAENARAKKSDINCRRTALRVKAMIPFILDRMDRRPTDRPTMVATHLRLRNKAFRAMFVENGSPHKVGRTTIERDVSMIVAEAKKIADAS